MTYSSSNKLHNDNSNLSPETTDSDCKLQTLEEINISEEEFDTFFFKDSSNVNNLSNLLGFIQNLENHSTNPTDLSYHIVKDKIIRLFEGNKLEKEIRPTKRQFYPIIEWEGYVDEITETEFFVKMVNLRSNSTIPEDMASFSIIKDVGDEDRKLLKEGAIVRYVLGWETLPGGQSRRVSELYFRRLPAHTKKDYERAKIKAKKLLDSINWSNETTTG